jgi:uncharacterized protein
MADSVSSDTRVARTLRGFGPLGIAVFVVLLLVGPAWLRAILILVWARCAGIPWCEIGYVRPKSWIATVVLGLVSGVVLKLLLKAVILPLLGAYPINQTYHYMVGNRALLPGMLFTLTVSAGFGEETVFRGYLFERLRWLLGKGRGAVAAIVFLSSALFGVAHYIDQGLLGVAHSFITGLVFGTMFAVTRQIWLPIITHAVFDLTALAMIYYDVEFAIAHWFFK